MKNEPLILLFEKLSNKQKDKSKYHVDSLLLHKISILEQQIQKQDELIKYLLEQDRQLRLVLKSKKLLNYKEAKV
jgi:hypothetical protein